MHRLPVVDKNGKLAGLITEGVITSNTPNNATSLSVFELNYLLNKLTIKDIMIKDVITIGKDALQRAYSTIPDLRSTQMFFGLSVDLEWKAGLNFNVIIE